MTKSEEKIIGRIRKVSLVLFITALIVFVYSSLAADSGLLEFHNYEFEIDIKPDDTQNQDSQTQLQNFQLDYDFVKNEGKIHFDMTKTNSTDNLIFYLPKELTVNTFTWTSRHLEGNNFSNYLNGTDYMQDGGFCCYPTKFCFSVENINKTTKNYSSTIDLSFKGRLYPNAEFKFTRDAGIIKPPQGTERGAFFKFNLGEKYTCIQPICYRNTGLNEVYFGYWGNKLTVSTKKEGDRWGEVDSHAFNLNYNKENNETLVYWREKSFDILLLSFLPTLEFLILNFFSPLVNFLSTNHKKSKRKPRKKKKTKK